MVATGCQFTIPYGLLGNPLEGAGKHASKKKLLVSGVVFWYVPGGDVEGKILGSNWDFSPASPWGRLQFGSLSRVPKDLRKFATWIFTDELNG